jgi:tetratricopeptide (TPR) repeat protein
MYPHLKTEKHLTPAQRNTYLKALHALETKQYGLATSLLGPLVVEEPEFFAARKQLRQAQILGSTGKTTFLGLPGGGSSLGPNKVRNLIESGDFKTALAEVEKVLASNPTGANSNKDLHKIAEGAAAATRRSLASLSEALSAAAEAEKGQISRQLEDLQEKLRTYEAIARFALETIPFDKKNSQPRHELGDYLLRIKEYDAASAVFREILKSDAKDGEATRKLKEVEARRALDEMDAPKESERSPTPEPETLEKLRKEVIEAGEETPDLVKTRKLADLYYKERQFQEASAWYNYLSECTGHTDALLLDLVRKCRDRHFETETAELRKALDGLQPGDNSAEEIRAKIGRLEREQADRSLADARQRVERNPTDLKHRLDLGRCLKEAQRYEEAIPELQRASGHPGAHIDAMVLLAKCFSELKMFDLAIDILNETEEQIPEMNEAKKETLYNLGIVYGLSGSNDKSLECMKRIYKKDCTYRDVAERVEESYKA